MATNNNRNPQSHQEIRTDKGLFLGAFGELLWQKKLAISAAMAKSVSCYDSWRAIVGSGITFIHPNPDTNPIDSSSAK
jgi:hypothetical protein